MPVEAARTRQSLTSSTQHPSPRGSNGSGGDRTVRIALPPSTSLNIDPSLEAPFGSASANATPAASALRTSGATRAFGGRRATRMSVAPDGFVPLTTTDNAAAAAAQAMRDKVSSAAAARRRAEQQIATRRLGAQLQERLNTLRELAHTLRGVTELHTVSLSRVSEWAGVMSTEVEACEMLTASLPAFVADADVSLLNGGGGSGDRHRSTSSPHSGSPNGKRGTLFFGSGMAASSARHGSVASALVGGFSASTSVTRTLNLSAPPLPSSSISQPPPPPPPPTNSVPDTGREARILAVPSERDGARMMNLACAIHGMLDGAARALHAARVALLVPYRGNAAELRPVSGVGFDKDPFGNSTGGIGSSSNMAPGALAAAAAAGTGPGSGGAAGGPSALASMLRDASTPEGLCFRTQMVVVCSNGNNPTAEIEIDATLEYFSNAAAAQLQHQPTLGPMPSASLAATAAGNEATTAWFASAGNFSTRAVAGSPGAANANARNQTGAAPSGMPRRKMLCSTRSRYWSRLCLPVRVDACAPTQGVLVFLNKDAGVSQFTNGDASVAFGVSTALAGLLQRCNDFELLARCYFDRPPPALPPLPPPLAAPKGVASAQLSTPGSRTQLIFNTADVHQQGHHDVKILVDRDSISAMAVGGGAAAGGGNFGLFGAVSPLTAALEASQPPPVAVPFARATDRAVMAVATRLDQHTPLLHVAAYIDDLQQSWRDAVLLNHQLRRAHEERTSVVTALLARARNSELLNQVLEMQRVMQVQDSELSAAFQLRQRRSTAASGDEGNNNVAGDDSITGDAAAAERRRRRRSSQRKQSDAIEAPASPSDDDDDESGQRFVSRFAAAAARQPPALATRSGDTTAAAAPSNDAADDDDDEFDGTMYFSTNATAAEAAAAAAAATSSSSGGLNTTTGSNNNNAVVASAATTVGVSTSTAGQAMSFHIPTPAVGASTVVADTAMTPVYGAAASPFQPGRRQPSPQSLAAAAAAAGGGGGGLRVTTGGFDSRVASRSSSFNTMGTAGGSGGAAAAAADASGVGVAGVPMLPSPLPSFRRNSPRNNNGTNNSGNLPSSSSGRRGGGSFSGRTSPRLPDLTPPPQTTSQQQQQQLLLAHPQFQAHPSFSSATSTPRPPSTPSRSGGGGGKRGTVAMMTTTATRPDISPADGATSHPELPRLMSVENANASTLSISGAAAAAATGALGIAVGSSTSASGGGAFATAAAGVGSGSVPLHAGSPPLLHRSAAASSSTSTPTPGRHADMLLVFAPPSSSSSTAAAAATSVGATAIAADGGLRNESFRARELLFGRDAARSSLRAAEAAAIADLHNGL